MRIDFSHKTADVYRINEKGTYFVKVSFPEVGLYITGIRVVPSKDNKGEYVVYKPKICLGFNKWMTNYEFSNSSELWLLIKEEALKAVDVYHVSHQFEDIETIDISQALDQAVNHLNNQEPP